MGQLRHVDASLLVIACFSRHAEALQWAQEQLTQEFGPLGPVSNDYSFHHTRYYERDMGPDLVKRLLTFQRLGPSDSLPELKNRTNQIEEMLVGRFSEPR